MTAPHPLEKRALHFIREHRLVEKGAHVLAAVSGGPDSTALLCVLDALRLELDLNRLSVLHMDHQLRGEASKADGEFVRALAESFGLCFVVKSQDVRAYQRDRRLSLEMAARACRHAFFQDALVSLSAHAIALGHTANDQAEEILLRLVRGTGPSGLAGMAPAGGSHLIRPLLFASRPEILDYLAAKKIPFREDGSNAEPFCQRNAIRLKVLPILQSHFHPRIERTLSRNARLVQEEESYWREQIEACWPSVCRQEHDSSLVLNRDALLRLHPALVRRLLRFAIERLRQNLLGIYAVHIESLKRWAARASHGRTLQLPGGIRARAEGADLVFFVESASSAPAPVEPFCFTLDGPGSVEIASLQLSLDLRTLSVPAGSPVPRSSPDRVWMDAHTIRWPMSVRSWKPGDRFQPLGLAGTKKLQDFFTDTKIPHAERLRIPILCDREKICWIAGLRLDDRVKVTGQTTRVLAANLSIRSDGCPEEAG